MKRREQALKLLEKAAQDEFVMDKLISDPASPDEIKVLDHLIVSKKGYVSMKEKGLL